jgi:hypothetical protein
MRVRWTLPAAGDLTQICDYIQKHGSGATAPSRTLHLRECRITREISKARGHGSQSKHPRACPWRPTLSSRFTAPTSWKSFASCTALSSAHNFAIELELADAAFPRQVFPSYSISNAKYCNPPSRSICKTTADPDLISRTAPRNVSTESIGLVFSA